MKEKKSEEELHDTEDLVESIRSCLGSLKLSRNTSLDSDVIECLQKSAEDMIAEANRHSIFIPSPMPTLIVAKDKRYK